jgi:hypothetical protein
MSGHIPIALPRGSLDSRREQSDDLQASNSGQWPRTWQDASSWAAREPRVAGSLQVGCMQYKIRPQPAGNQLLQGVNIDAAKTLHSIGSFLQIRLAAVQSNSQPP